MKVWNKGRWGIGDSHQSLISPSLHNKIAKNATRPRSIKDHALFYLPQVFIKMTSLVLFAVALLFSVAVGSPLTENRLFGGQEAKPGQFPYQVFFRRHGNVKCGGAIISDRFVLTAAHCLLGINPSEFSLVVGAHTASVPDGRVLKMARFIPHEDNGDTDTPTFEHDVGLIEVKYPIEFDEFVSPIALNREFIRDGVHAVLAGYGQTNVRFKSRFKP